MQNYEVRQVVNLPSEEIERIQEEINAQNLEEIEEAFQKKRINEEERDYLTEFFFDSMTLYREVYRTWYEMFRHPEYTCAIDLKTGKVDKDINGRKINYGLKAVTPFTCTRLDYVDKFHNPIYVIFPKMKTAARAIQKLESEYGKEYHQEIAKASSLIFEKEDRDAYAEKIQSITKSSAKLHDILRLTVTCKYFTDVERIKKVITENSKKINATYYINEKETRDRFLKPHSENKKLYYDIKTIVHQKMPNNKFVDVEVQLKIHTLYNADLRTHKIYEDVRSTESLLATNSYRMEPDEIRQQEAKIKIWNNRIRKINENAIHEYNMMVIDKARRIEDDGYRALQIRPDFSDGTYKRCRNLINDEYLVASFDEFDPQTAFSADNETNKLCFLRMLNKVEPDFCEFDDHAASIIFKKFADLTPAEIERFNEINEVAHRYAPQIRQKIKQHNHSEIMEQVSLPNLLNKKGGR